MTEQELLICLNLKAIERFRRFQAGESLRTIYGTNDRHYATESWRNDCFKLAEAFVATCADTDSPPRAERLSKPLP